MGPAVIGQILKQMWGVILLEHRYKGKLPNCENYPGETRYSLPFQGRWVVVNGGVTKETSHSWDVPPQRYAYDFLILDPEGRSYSGEETEASSFYCYGSDVLAPADGVVAEVCRGNPDSKITPNRAASCKARDLRGNYISIRHANNEYSLLAHLKPDSILVFAGQEVKRGKKIAECGNSGNTSEPHLHFQVQLGQNFYSAPGLPIGFAGISVQDTANYERFDPRSLNRKGESSYPPYITLGQTVANLTNQ